MVFLIIGFGILALIGLVMPMPKSPEVCVIPKMKPMTSVQRQQRQVATNIEKFRSGEVSLKEFFN